MGYTGKSYSPNIVFNTHWKNVTDIIFFLPHISSTYFGEIIPLYQPLSMIPNIKETSALLAVVEVVVEIVEAVVVENVVERMA